MFEPISNKDQSNVHKLGSSKWTLWDNITFTFETVADVIRYYPIQLYRNIKRVIYWLPVIWNDRDYDHEYIYKIVRHKLNSVAKDAKRWNWVGSEGQQRKLERLVQLIDYYLDPELEDKLTEYELEEFAKKYGEIVHWGTRCEDGMILHHSGLTKVDDQETCEIASKELMKIYCLQAQRRAAVRNRIWKTIGKHIDRWWN